MKTQISRISHDPAKHYSGVYLQQGRMIVDADWNELADIVSGRLAAALEDVVAAGAPREGGLRVTLSAGNPRILPGRLYAEGVAAALDGPVSGIAPTAQPEYPNPPPLAGNVRFYADIWERTVTALEDTDLLDPGLHGADTASRTRSMLQVKWCATTVDPANAAVNPPQGDAPLALMLRLVAAGADACDPCAAEVEVNERLGNYLFRVEVHDVFDEAGDRILVLKWSRDNGAEAYAVSQEPADFRAGTWVWEFFDVATEQMLGSHFPLGARRRRGLLRESFSIPAGIGEPSSLVRQWDGYAEINLSDHTLRAGRDRGVPLSTGVAETAQGRVSFPDGRLHINLELMELDLGLDDHQFVAGDYWLATVRDAVAESGDWVLGEAPATLGGAPAGVPPVGIRHHYLRLDDFVGGALLPPAQPEDSPLSPAAWADAFRRQMHFPPLTDLHAADVAYTQPSGCNGLYAGAVNVQQALDRLCDIDAADIGYSEPNCPSTASVRALLAAALGAAWPNVDGQVKAPSVKDMLDALLCHLAAATLPYTVPPCAETPNVAGGLGFTAGEASPVATVLDRLLCQLNGDDIPLDLDTLTCQELVDSGATSVQQGLDYLCGTRITSCAVTVPVGELENLLRAFAADTTRTDLWLCLLPGEHTIAAALDVTGKRSLRLSAAAAGASTVFFSAAPATLSAQEIGIEGIRCRFASTARLTLQGNRIVASRAIFVRSSASDTLPPMVRVDPLASGSELIWRDNVMQDTWQRRSDNTRGFFDVATVGNVAVANRFERLFQDPAVMEDEARFNVQVDALAREIAAMPGTQRLAWRNRLGGSGPTRPRASLNRLTVNAPLITALTDSTSVGFLANASVGALSVEEARPVAASAIDRINAVGNDATAIGGIIRDDLITVLFETGYGIAFALGNHSLSGSLTDNHFDGELLLSNGLDAGIDPRTTALTDHAPDSVVQPAAGHLTLTGNRIQRLWTRLPTGSIANGRLLQPVPGYESMALTGNQLVGYGHSAVAALLTVQGNRFVNGPVRTPTPLALLFANGAALSANGATFVDGLTHLVAHAPLVQAAANLMRVEPHLIVP